jgi:hypothetical protein
MPEKLAADPLLMARAVKRASAAVRLLALTLMGAIVWIAILSGLIVGSRNDEQESRLEQQRSDCVLAIEARENAERIAIEQWTTIAEQDGPDPEGVQYAIDFVTAQYDKLPPPGPCE